jgi:hypothetical protein
VEGSFKATIKFCMRSVLPIPVILVGGMDPSGTLYTSKYSAKYMI